MARNSLESRLMEQSDMIMQLNKMILSLQQTIEGFNAKEAALLQEIQTIKEQNDYLTQKLFGKSSEKNSWDMEGQLNLFNEAEQEQDTSLLEEEQEETKTVTFTVRKGRSADRDRYAGLPVEKKYLDVPEEERFCPDCESPLLEIGETFVRRELKFKPASFKVVEYYSKNYKCPKCSPNLKTPVIVQGKDGRAHMLHGMASASTVAWVMYQKYVNAMPLYRIERDFKQYGVNITRATLANWVIQNTDRFFSPFYAYLHKLLLKRVFIMADETVIQVLHEEDRRPESKSYMWIFRSGEDGQNPIILYKYSPTRAGETATDFLDDFSGYIMCDGYSGYNKLKKAKRTTCWSHVRRYLLDAIPKGKKMDYTLPAVQGAMYVDKLFHLEKEIKKKHKNDYESIKAARLEKEVPVLEGFWSWFEKQHAVKESRMEKALTYIQNRRSDMMTYLEDGRCSFCNNLSEIEVKPVALGRKNYLFSDTTAGADSSAVIYSLVETAKANGLNMYHYLWYLLEELPRTDLLEEAFEKYLPWKPEVKNALEEKAQKILED